MRYVFFILLLVVVLLLLLLLLYVKSEQKIYRNGEKHFERRAKKWRYIFKNKKITIRLNSKINLLTLLDFKFDWITSFPSQFQYIFFSYFFLLCAVFAYRLRLSFGQFTVAFFVQIPMYLLKKKSKWEEKGSSIYKYIFLSWCPYFVFWSQ